VGQDLRAALYSDLNELQYPYAIAVSAIGECRRRRLSGTVNEAHFANFSLGLIAALQVAF
jgi:hypothetical protein